MYNFDPYNVLLAIAINIPERLNTAFVLQGHIYGEHEDWTVLYVLLWLLTFEWTSHFKAALKAGAGVSGGAVDDTDVE